MKWENCQLRDIANYWTGKVEATILDATNYISTDNLLPDKGGVVNSNYVPVSGNVNSYSENDVLISNIRPYFKKIWIADKSGGCSNDVLVFRSKENVEPQYLYYQLSRDAFFDDMVAGSNGTKMPRGNKTSIMEFKLQLPPLPTQRKIASILSAYDDLIENNLKRIKLLEEKAFLSYKILEKSAKLKLEELYDTSSGGTPSRTNAEFYTGDINWFKSKELNDSVLLESEEKITEQAVDKSSAKLFPAGSVIMAMYGATIGKLGMLSVPSTTNQACCAIMQKDEIRSNFYIINWLLDNREYVLSFRMGAAQENISQQVIRNLLVAIPKESDLRNFNEEMRPIYQVIKYLHQQNTKLREARNILLPRLMNGQIEV